MADHGSWRRRPREAGIGGGGGGATLTTSSVGTSSPPGAEKPKHKPASSNSASASGSDNGGSSGYDVVAAKPTSANVHARPTAQRTPRPVNVEGSGPAAPLKPLHIASVAPAVSDNTRLPLLPHPSAYAGSDNWAFTPNDSLPSLPATPSRAMKVLGWQRTSTPGSEGSGGGVTNNSSHARTGSSSGAAHVTPGRDTTLIARSMLNKRMDEQRTYSPSPSRNQQRPLSKPSTGTPPPSAIVGAPGNAFLRTLSSPSDAHSTNPAHNATSQPPASISAVLTQANNQLDSPRITSNALTLHHRESVTSLASSTQHTFNPHPLSHSRRPSQIFTQSPALSNGSTGAAHARATPSYRVYRPPHLRTDSYYGLQSPMAHYDRVSAPSLRGQSRSPSVSRSRENSVAVSRSPSQGVVPPSTSTSTGPTRRLSHLGAQNTIIESSNALSMDGLATLDHGSLISKLANVKLDLRTQRERNSPRGGGSGDHLDEDGGGSDAANSASQQHRDSAVEDVDLTAEDMMMSSALTDEYCRSRSTSFSEPAPFVDILETGDRLGPGLMHDGLEITIAETSEGFSEQSADRSGTQLEVVSKLGEGSYAVVYLVKEVPRDSPSKADQSTTTIESSTYKASSTIPPTDDRTFDAQEADETVLHSSEDVYSTTLRADASGRLAAASDDETGQDPLFPRPNEGEKYFALKCLCKRDLSDEMLEVQRLEATIHQSIPTHPNIVTLYRTYETAEWLFLVLEYCPGQDLFYWLEQAHDTENLGSSTPGGAGDRSLSPVPVHAQDSTPPSPSLLASTGSQFLLSRRRLRLISRMFHQICDAVAFCHARGISHRDIKPENFIVEDTRTSESSLNGGTDDSNHSGGGSDGAGGGIKVKLTDFGLAVAQTHCIDFDCGSKPYMSYECRNNTSRWYNPIESDIWSLGIVLLNLIFHRSPFTEPNAERCPSFASYVEDPVRFLTTAFRGLKEEAAQFLAENVFCDVTEDESTGERRHRISAKEFGEWASMLVDHLAVPNGQHQMQESATLLSPPESVVSGADFGITSPMSHSRSPSSSLVNSLMASPASNARLINIHQELTNMGISEEEIENFTPLFNDSVMVTPSAAAENSISAGSQTRSESIAPAAAVPPPHSTDKERHKTECAPTSKVLEDNQAVSGTTTANTRSSSDRPDERATDSTQIKTNSGEEDVASAHNVSVEKKGTGDAGNYDEDGIEGEDTTGDTDNASLLAPPSVTSTLANSKRRKRGARRSRTLAKQQLKRSHSAENLQANNGNKDDDSSPVDTARERTIRELAAASESLAREMSKAMQQRDAKAAAAEQSTAMVQNGAVLDSAKVLGAVSTSGTAGGSRAVPRMVPPALVSSKPVLQDSGRSRIIHPSSTAADWRERNTSNVSLASVSSFNSVSSFSSDVGSIRSTASAPPALISQHRARSGGGPASTTSSRTSGLSSGGGGSGSGGSSITRGLLAAGSNLGTINERGSAFATTSTMPSRGSQKDLDASYLAEIFGGRSHHHSTRTQRQPQSVAARSGHGHQQAANAAAAVPSLSGIQGGALEAALAERNRSHQNPVRRSTAAASSQTALNSGALSRGGMHTDAAASTVPAEELPSSSDAGAPVPRKKMLGKFLQGVKSYNKGVKAAPAMPEEQQ